MTSDDAPQWMLNYRKDTLSQMTQRIKDAVVEATKEANEKIAVLQEKNIKQERVIVHLKQQHNELKERTIQNEARAMRENLVFSGLYF